MFNKEFKFAVCVLGVLFFSIPFILHLLDGICNYKTARFNKMKVPEGQVLVYSNGTAVPENRFNQEHYNDIFITFCDTVFPARYKTIFRTAENYTCSLSISIDMKKKLDIPCLTNDYLLPTVFSQFNFDVKEISGEGNFILRQRIRIAERESVIAAMLNQFENKTIDFLGQSSFAEITKVDNFFLKKLSDFLTLQIHRYYPFMFVEKIWLQDNYFSCDFTL